MSLTGVLTPWNCFEHPKSASFAIPCKRIVNKAPKANVSQHPERRQIPKQVAKFAYLPPRNMAGGNRVSVGIFHVRGSKTEP